MAVESAIGSGLGVLGGLISLKSQSDLLDKKLRERNAAELATRQASDQMQRSVISAAQQSQGGVGLLQGLRAADQMQRRALPQIQQAKMADMARQDIFDREQRLRQEKMWQGLAQGLAGAGTQLALSQQNPSQPGTAGHAGGVSSAGTLGALAGLGGSQQAAQGAFDEQGDAWSPTPGATALTPPPAPVPSAPGAESLTPPPTNTLGASGISNLSGAEALQAQQWRSMGMDEYEIMRRLGY